MRKSTVSPNIKFLVKSQTGNNSIPKTLKNIFVFAQIMFALNFGFIETKYLTRRVLKFISILQSLIFIGCVLYHSVYVTNDINMWFLADIIIYLMFVTVTISFQYTYSDFQADLISFDSEIKADSSSYKLDMKLIIFFLTTVSFLILYLLMVFIYVPERIKFMSFYEFSWHSILVFSVDFVRITYGFVFCSTYWRICEFIKFVNNDYFDIVSCQYLYKNIVEITEKAKANYNFVFMITLMYNTAIITVILFIPFADNSVKNRPIMMIITDLILVTKHLIILFAPTYTAGLLAAEVEKLVLLLRDKILVAKDEKLRQDIRRFISYIEARSMKFTVCNVIPLDWNLPIIIINLAITYLIVMIQFNHKY